MKILKLKTLLEKKKKKTKKDRMKLNAEEYKEVNKKFGKDRECSIGKDVDGYFFYTHRARSKSHKEIKDMPMKDFNFISSTS